MRGAKLKIFRDDIKSCREKDKKAFPLSRHGFTIKTTAGAYASPGNAIPGQD
jgi:hypothetical protein